MKATLVGFDVTTATVTLKLDKPAVGAAIGEEWEADTAKKVPSTHNDGGPAFPTTNGMVTQDGMSLRDWLAGQALAGILANQQLLVIIDNELRCDSTRDGAAVYAYAVADSAMKVRGQ